MLLTPPGVGSVEFGKVEQGSGLSFCIFFLNTSFNKIKSNLNSFVC